MKIAILDDQKEDREQAAALLRPALEYRGIDPELGLFSGGEEFFRYYTKGKYEMVLLDLYMEKDSGMEIARELRRRGEECQLVFITNSRDSAVDSYEVDAAYYLIKPVTAEGMEAMISRCLKRMGQQPDTVELLINRSTVRVPVDQILWANTFQNAIHLHTDDGELKTYMTFEKFARLLSGYENFLACYKGCLVNMDRIDCVTESDFQMDNGDLVQIKKRGKNLIKRQYTQYLCKKASQE